MIYVVSGGKGSTSPNSSNISSITVFANNTSTIGCKNASGIFLTPSVVNNSLVVYQVKVGTYTITNNNLDVQNVTITAVGEHKEVRVGNGTRLYIVTRGLANPDLGVTCGVAPSQSTAYYAAYDINTAGVKFTISPPIPLGAYKTLIMVDSWNHSSSWNGIAVDLKYQNTTFLTGRIPNFYYRTQVNPEGGTSSTNLQFLDLRLADGLDQIVFRSTNSTTFGSWIYSLILHTTTVTEFQAGATI